MEYDEAVKKLEELANGRYQGLLRWDFPGLDKDTSIIEYPIYQVYIDGYHHHSGKSWEEAFENLEKAIEEKKKNA